MQVQVDGKRSTDEHWLEAQRVSPGDLPELSQGDPELAKSMGISAEIYARNLYAGVLSQPEMKRKVESVALLAENWLTEHGRSGEVEHARLRTLQGLIELRIATRGGIRKLEIQEEIVDSLMQAGSREAAESLDRLFPANFGRLMISKAS